MLSDQSKGLIVAILLAVNFSAAGFLVGKSIGEKKQKEKIETLQKEIEAIIPEKEDLPEKFWEKLPPPRKKPLILKDGVFEGYVVKKRNNGFLLKAKGMGLLAVKANESEIREQKIEAGDKVVVKGTFSKVGRFLVFEAKEIKKVE